jgi:hypothetical protein
MHNEMRPSMLVIALFDSLLLIGSIPARKRSISSYNICIPL